MVDVTAVLTLGGLAALFVVGRVLLARIGMFLAVMALLLVVAGVVGTLDTAIPTSTTDTATSTRDIAIPWADTDVDVRWPSSNRCPDALDPPLALVGLTARVDVLHALRSGFSQDHGTTAILRGENALGECRDFVATQTDTNVEPAIRDALLIGEVPVWSETGLPTGWKDMHAEQKAVHAAWNAGFRPVAIASSRPFCDGGGGRMSCSTWLDQAGARRATNRTAYWLW